MKSLVLQFSILIILASLSSANAAQPRYPKTLDGLKFESVNEFTIGVLPSGPVSGHRMLSFQNGQFTYMPSDGVETGHYVWKSNTGQVAGTALSRYRYSGQYDLKSKTLTWGGVKYRLKP